jgi:hypothetical protein
MDTTLLHLLKDTDTSLLLLPVNNTHQQCSIDQRAMALDMGKGLGCPASSLDSSFTIAI